MIDLTPLDVRNKRGDFRRTMRGYDADEVNTFLEIVAERLESLVRENLQLRERAGNLAAQVDTQAGREKAVQEALVTAQELRSDIRTAAEREAELTLSEARAEAKRILTEAEAEARSRARHIEERLEQGRDVLEELDRRRVRFLKSFRQLLQRELEVIEVEAARGPERDDPPVDLDLGARRHDGVGQTGADEVARDEAAAPGAEPARSPRDATEQAIADLEAMREALAAAATDIGRLAPESKAGKQDGGEGANVDGGEGAKVDDRELFPLPDIPSGGDERSKDAPGG